jgi:hypothetical protein
MKRMAAILVALSATMAFSTAAHASPKVLTGTGQLCITSGTCIVTHGSGQQLTIQNSGYATLTVVTGVSCGNGCVFVTIHVKSNGNCIRENSSNAVNEESGPCNNSDNNEVWLRQTVGSGWSFLNDGRNNYMSTTGTDPNDKVWGGFNPFNVWFAS